MTFKTISQFIVVIFGFLSILLFSWASAAGKLNLNDPLGARVIYFEFDSNALTWEAQRIVEAHAEYLAGNPGMAVVLEGHADERGTREYNLALGERRANSVADLFQMMGVMSDAVRSISYGEERPVAMEHDESAWSLNRRVEILY